MNKPTKDRKMTRARALETLKQESALYRAFMKDDQYADALDIFIAHLRIRWR